jgi:hypothetical protein
MVAQLVPAADPAPLSQIHPVAVAPAGLDPSLLLGEPVNLADAYHRTIAHYCGRLKPGVRLVWRGRPDGVITAVDPWSVVFVTVEATFIWNVWDLIDEMDQHQVLVVL